MADTDMGGRYHPAKKWYDQFSLKDDYYTGGHFARDPTNGAAHFLNPPEEVVENARESAESLGLTVAEHRTVHGPYETVFLRVFDHRETTLAEVMVEQGIPDTIHEIALYERRYLHTGREQEGDD